MEYDVQISKMIKPRFKIVSYRGNLKKEDVETCLRDQNQFINDSEELKINFIKTNKRKRTKTIYGECNATLFKKFVNKGKVFLQWERYPIYEDFVDYVVLSVRNFSIGVIIVQMQIDVIIVVKIIL